MNKKPMPLEKFINELGKLAKQKKWLAYKLAVKKRKEWFENHPNEGVF